MIQMKVKHIGIEQDTGNPVVFLSDMEDTRMLPIWIGPFEAQSIAMVIEDKAAPRPMTHDLMKALIEQLNGKVQRVVVTDLQNQTFFARIVLAQDGKETEVDARPSDSIALAVRFGAPIFVTENVIRQASFPDSKKIERDKEEFKQFIERIKPEMFANAIVRKPEDPLKPGDPDEGKK